MMKTSVHTNTSLFYSQLDLFSCVTSWRRKNKSSELAAVVGDAFSSKSTALNEVLTF